MASNFHQWESDPLFSAAEVVQDSADRMESIFRLLLHEQTIVQGDHPDPKLYSSREYRNRELATTIEMTKWQLEDFEKEVSISAIADKYLENKNVISRHKKFIGAIREQIIYVEKSLEKISEGNSARNTEWISLNDQDRDGLALFLSGGKPVGLVHNDLEDSNSIRRFFDPTDSSSFSDGIVEQNASDILNLNTNGTVHLENNFEVKENKLRKVASHYSTPMGIEGPSFLQEASCDQTEVESWDLEANLENCKSSFNKNKLRSYCKKMNIFGSLGSLLSANGSRASRNFAKRWKVEKEQRHTSSYNDVTLSAQSHRKRPRLASGYSRIQQLWLELSARVMPLHAQANPLSVLAILVILLILGVIGILAYEVA